MAVRQQSSVIASYSETPHSLLCGQVQGHQSIQYKMLANRCWTATFLTRNRLMSNKLVLCVIHDNYRLGISCSLASPPQHNISLHHRGTAHYEVNKPTHTNNHIPDRHADKRRMTLTSDKCLYTMASRSKTYLFG